MPVWNDELQQWGYHPFETVYKCEWLGIDRRLMMPKYQIDARMQTRLDNDFKYHAPKDDQQERYIAIRDKAKELAVTICENSPASREQSVALTELDHVVMMANAAIARNE